jgi:hypothetical protein
VVFWLDEDVQPIVASPVASMLEWRCIEGVPICLRSSFERLSLVIAFEAGVGAISFESPCTNYPCCAPVSQGINCAGCLPTHVPPNLFFYVDAPTLNTIDACAGSVCCTGAGPSCSVNQVLPCYTYPAGDLVYSDFKCKTELGTFSHDIQFSTLQCSGTCPISLLS